MINISEFLKEKFREWCIHQKICAIVSDNASNILGAVRIGGWRSISCFAHTINLVVKDSLEIIADTVIKVKNVVEFFNRSLPAQRKLKEIQEQMHLAPLKLKQDVCTRWNSTYDMLNRFLKIKEALIASIAIMRAELALTPNDWMIIEKSLPILSIFYEVSNEVSAENYVSASKYIVLCKLMYVQIQKFSNETVETIKGLVSFFKTELMHRFGDIEKNMLLREATILDPRFKKSGFRDIRNFEAAAADLKLKIGRIVLSDERPLQPAEPVEPTPGCSKVSSLWEQFDEEVARQVPENPVAAGIVEFDKYMNEPQINRHCDLLLWWKERKAIYPRLHSHMLKRLNITATSVPCERVFSKAGLTLNDRRTRLTTKKLTQLMFISCN
ncbi:unnamed protein product [Parnassius mnemosyne]